VSVMVNKLAVMLSLLVAVEAEAKDFSLEDESAKTMIEFDAGIIEDVDLRKMSITDVTARGKALKKRHLYRRMMTFDREMKESYREFRYQQ